MKDSPVVLVTGANGFLGSRIIKTLESNDLWKARGALRKPSTSSDVVTDMYCVGNISDDTDWSESLSGVHTVIHTAGMVHISNEQDFVDLKAEYIRINVHGTINLARQAISAGVKRFVFISTIGVNGNKNSVPFTADDEPNPVDFYARSKLEAERALIELEKRDMDVVIVRPALIYGPGSPGNFGKLVRLINTGLPLPFGNMVSNRRSFVALDNLVDLLITCIKDPKAANQVFLVADLGCCSTLEFVSKVAKAMGRSARLISIPDSLILFFAKLFGKQDLCLRVMGSLEVDIQKNKDILGWEPPLTLEEGLKRCFKKS